MNLPGIQTVCVCGSGTMGSGIAQVAAAAGFTTLLFDIDAAALERARGRLDKDLQKLVDKGKLEAGARQELWQRLRFTTDLADCRGDVVIEAVVERMDVKLSLFRSLAAHNGEHTLFASNTSSLSISGLAAGLPVAERFAGLHFFNPAPLMKLVEVVKGDRTASGTVQQLVDLTKAMGKTPVVCTDAPGFIVNRVARPYYIEALRLAEQGAEPALIDRLLEQRGFRMGPFRLMDLIGNDINYAVSCSVWEQLGKPGRLKPSAIQQAKVEAGQLGRKSGQGYYDYSEKGA